MREVLHDRLQPVIALAHLHNAQPNFYKTNDYGELTHHTFVSACSQLTDIMPPVPGDNEVEVVQMSVEKVDEHTSRGIIDKLSLDSEICKVAFRQSTLPTVSLISAIQGIDIVKAKSNMDEVTIVYLRIIHS